MTKNHKRYSIFSIGMLICSMFLFGLYFTEAQKLAGLELSAYESKDRGFVVAIYLLGSLVTGAIGLVSLIFSLTRRKGSQTK